MFGVGTGPPNALDIEKPTSSDMNSRTLGAPCGARIGACDEGFESSTFSAITPENGAGMIGRMLRSWAKD
jgi:hypothetical protein